jgi:hypothetical protein
MYKAYLTFLLIIIFSVKSSFAQQLTDEGLKKFWSITQTLKKNDVVSEKDWQSLWNCTGYNEWMSSERSQKIFKDYFSLVYNLVLKDSLDKEIKKSKGYRVVMFEHFIEAKQKEEELKEFIKHLKASNIIEEAKTIASKHLPSNFDLNKDSIEITLMLFQPDAFAIEGKNLIIMDVLHAYNYGKDLKKLLAHELHHVYVLDYISKLKKVEENDIYFPLIQSIDKIRLEGLANLIDKDDILNRKNKTNYESEFSKHYNNSQTQLIKIDSLLQELSIKDETFVEDYGKQIRRELKFSGHPLGLYIAKLIQDNFDEEELLSCLKNPFIFLKLYNKVAKLQTNKYYILSDKSMRFLEELEYKFIK